MQIVILGAGISGLSTYLFIRKHFPLAENDSITVFEKYPTELHDQISRASIADDAGIPGFTASEGGAIGIGPNGLNVLRRLDESLFHDIVREGYPILSWKIGTARGWKLADARVHSRDTPPITTVMIARRPLWECIRKRVPPKAIIRPEVTGIKIIGARGPCVVEFSESEDSITVELVLGCDGLRSMVRRAIFERPDEKHLLEPHYEGLVGVSGFIDSRHLVKTGVKDGEMGIVFGPNGFFGYGPVVSKASTPDRHLAYAALPPGPKAAWWSTYPVSKCPDWRQHDPDTLIAAKRQMIERHQKWQEPTVQRIMSHVEVGSLYPTWTTAELPRWHYTGRCVLLGDAAHALQPSSGQGACQALEDAGCFALFLTHYVSQFRKPSDFSSSGESSLAEALLAAAENYQTLRTPRVKRICDRSQKMSRMKENIGFIQEMLMYLFVWLIGT